MSKSLFAAAAALAVVASAPAMARTQNEQGSAAAGQKKEARKICRTFDNSASRMKTQRVCLTREQWKKFDSAQ